MTALLSLASCQEKGCTDEVATNYNQGATFEDGSCTYTFGCTDPEALNYDSNVGIDDGSCQTFVHWDQWVQIASSFGTDTFAAIAHDGFDTLSIRKVYVRNDQLPVDSIYPEGTMIVLYNYSLGDTMKAYSAMVKQAEGFNPTSNDWEWFMLNKDGSIAKDNTGELLRGGNLLDNYCTECHSKAAIDFVYSN
ncbi:MAG: hypothetical protein R2813_11405 [Flavobacteriales bacterium]